MAKHIHKYLLKDLGTKQEFWVYRCDLPGCGHYVAAHLGVGKETICWRCGEKCLIPRVRAERWIVRPHCMDCTKKYPQYAAKLKKQNGEKPPVPEISLKDLEDMNLDELLSDDMFETANDKKKE